MPIDTKLRERVLRERSNPISECRLCASKSIDMILTLGDQYVSDFVTSEGNNPLAPLELVRCNHCGLVQLKHTFSRGLLYRHYWYKSGISSTMRSALEDLVQNACQVAKPHEDEIVLDIGCNDGTLLRSYKAENLVRVGFEPARNLVEDARTGTSYVFNEFFSAKLFKEKFRERKARIVTSIAMFYDLDDPNGFVSDVRQVLSSDGVFVVQQNYLATMLENNGFDNIGHEHLEYYCLGTMQSLLARHGLEVFRVETNDVNGGSFRVYVCHRGKYPMEKSVPQMEQHESSLALGQRATYERFANNIVELKERAREFILEEVGHGKTVYVYGASNRGNTILQYFNLDHTVIKKATDANPEKWGRKTVGTMIPIVSKEEARRDKPDYFLILPHHFLDEIRQEEKLYLSSGGRFIVPLPDFRIVGK